MIQYFTDADESLLIGVCASDRSAESIAKIVSKLTDYDLVEAESDAFEEIGEFQQDTVIIDSDDFMEELLEITAKDIKIYLV
jgi:hypothetical protein